jgi:hypothetical protein
MRAMFHISRKKEMKMEHPVLHETPEGWNPEIRKRSRNELAGKAHGKRLSVKRNIRSHPGYFWGYTVHAGTSPRHVLGL